MDKPDFYDLPDTVADLAEVPEAYHGLYWQGEDGQHRMLPHAREMHDEFKAEVDTILADHEEWTAKADSDLAHERGLRTAATIDRAVRQALSAQGVPDNLAKATAALVMEQNTFKMEGTVALTETGLSVEAAVGLFLASDDGAAFRPAPKASATPGPLSAMARQH